MKKTELITLVCSLVFIGLVVGYLKFSSRIASAENEARKANELIAELTNAASDTSSTPPATTNSRLDSIPEHGPSLVKEADIEELERAEFIGVEEAESPLWHGAKLVVEVPDNLVRVDNSNSDIAKILKATKPEGYTLLFSFVDSRSLKAASEVRRDGDSAPLPYATITAPQDFLVPNRSPSITPAQMVEVMKMHMAQEKAKEDGLSKSAIISQSEHHILTSNRSQKEIKVSGKIETKEVTYVSSYIDAGDFFVMISVSGFSANESDIQNLVSINDGLREGMKIILDNP